jgi:UDP:flavonoid glycosyltransferase YjiC (YdhE family)
MLSGVRVMLGCSIGGLGHLTPVLAAARAIGRLGHETVVLVPPALSEAAAQAGVDFRVGAEPPRSVVDGLWERVRAGPPEAVAGLIDRELFAGHCTQAMLGAATGLCESWRPQFVVREPCEYATAIAAHRSGIPQAQVGISQSALEHDVLEQVARTLERHSRGLAGALGAAPYLTSFPGSLDPSPWPDTRRFHEPLIPGEPVPEWWPDGSGPLIYVTFGSVLGHLPEAGAVLRVALDAVAGLPARVLMTVGRAVDPADLAPAPENTRIERWVPQQDVFGHAHLVVCHGGSGTTFGALAAGLPLVICPLFADQSANARLVEQAGAGVVVRSRERVSGGLGTLRPEDVAPLRHAIESVLRNPGHAEAAGRIAREIASTPTLMDTFAGLLA